MSQHNRKFRTHVVRSHAATTGTPLASDAPLMTGGDVTQFAPGLIGLRGHVLRVFQFFEHEFRQLARRFAADERQYPVILPTETLEAVGYFGHFPHHVTFCSHFPEDLPLLEQVAQVASERGGVLPDELRAHIARAGHALKPAVCLPCYVEHRDSVLPDGEPRVVTMQNHVFRRETAAYDALARLWDFHVRDIVFLGSYAALDDRRRQVMHAAMDLCEALDLSARLELAHDPFFLDPSAHKAVYQRLGEVKFELLLAIPHRDSPIAASSFNLHRSFYAQAFHIRQANGELAETACMGFGLERWAYGFLCQKGLDPESWPAAVRDWVLG